MSMAATTLKNRALKVQPHSWLTLYTVGTVKSVYGYYYVTTTVSHVNKAQIEIRNIPELAKRVKAMQREEDAKTRLNGNATTITDIFGLLSL